MESIAQWGRRERFTLEVGLVLLGMVTVLLAGLGPRDTPAAAAAPAILWNSCDGEEPVGQRCSLPRGVAADSKDGHVFVDDQINSRIVEFDALGNFVKTWGWDVVESGPDNTGVGFEICIRENNDVCKSGVTGSGAGQLSQEAFGVALDSVGDVYVVDFSNNRVQKFDRKGNFALMIGGQVNETSGGNVCPRPGFPADVCRTSPAIEGGGGFGEFGPWGIGDFIATDPADNLYVGDHNRIQRFNTEGVYQDECSVPGTVQSLTTDSAGNLYATYENKLGVRKLSYLAGAECEELKRFEIPKLGIFGEKEPFPSAVAVDGTGHVYAFCCPDRTPGSPTLVDPIFEFDPAGNIVDEFGKEEFSASSGLATNLCKGSEAPGNLYVTNSVNGTGPPSSREAFVRAYGTEPTGCFKALTLPPSPIGETSATLRGTVNPDGSLSSECRFEYGLTTAYGNTAPCTETPAAIGEGTEPVPVHAAISGLQGGTAYHVRLRAKIGGETDTGPDVAFKTLGPPAISADHVASATDTEATLKALVNPEGFPTTCEAEYGPSASYGQSTPAVAVGSDRTEHPVLFILAGLKAGSAYHWRFVCKNTALKDGGLTEGADHTLNTYRSPGAIAPCPNDALRTGVSAFLPDCRAYEMVSPVDKNGADVVSERISAQDPGGYVQATTDGAKITYTTLFPTFGEDAPNSSALNQYLATRHEIGEPEEGWTSEGIHQPYLGRRIPGTVPGAFREFIAFSPDLCSAWVVDYQTPALNPDGQPDAANLYRRDNCDPGAGVFETLTTAPLGLEGDARSKYVDQYSVQGVSADSSQALFVARAALTGDAASGTNAQIYDRSGGALHLVSVLPGGVADPANTAVGSGRGNNLKNAVSEDGSRAYWTSGGNTGKIYLRLHPEQGITSGECGKGKACTVPVSAGSAAFFWAASPDGSKALYSEGEDLRVFDLKTESSQLVAKDVKGVAGTNEDLSRIYLVSRKALAGSGENSEGEEAEEGAPNLYLAEGSSFSYVATLAEGDVGKAEPGAAGVLGYDLISRGPYEHATRVSADGRQIAFESRAPLSDFDNADAESGKPAVEVYRYEAGGDLLCVSCNPSGARPATREMAQPYNPPYRGEQLLPNVQAAAWIPTWEHPLNASNALSKDGARLFFNANDALLPRDANGTQDVYEWEAAESGGCNPEDTSYFPQNGGCLYLISSGESSFEAEFWEASPAGQDVFFTTESSLLHRDPGSVDLYDARVGGGFPEPEPPAQCEGEACQSPPPPPEFGQPASSTYNAPGNPPPKAKHSCPKGKHSVRRKGKARCAPNHQANKHRKRRATHNRGAAR